MVVVVGSKVVDPQDLEVVALSMTRLLFHPPQLVLLLHVLHPIVLILGLVLEIRTNNKE